MAIVKTRPSTDYPTLSRSALSDFFDLDDFFTPATNWNWRRTTNVPAVNIRENSDHFEVEVAAPGLKKNDFNVNVENGLLTVNCQKEEETTKKDVNYTKREFSYLNFERTFRLPDYVQEDKIKAKYDDGILRITIPMKTEAKKQKPTQVKID